MYCCANSKKKEKDGIDQLKLEEEEQIKSRKKLQEAGENKFLMKLMT